MDRKREMIVAIQKMIEATREFDQLFEQTTSETAYWANEHAPEDMIELEELHDILIEWRDNMHYSLQGDKTDHELKRTE